MIGERGSGMRVRDLTTKLKKWDMVTIKDSNTSKTIWKGQAGFAYLYDTVKDWDFSNGYIIYINYVERSYENEFAD